MVNHAANPHNETFMIALQVGVLGVVVLYGMWSAHARLFTGPGVAAWFGLSVMAHNTERLDVEFVATLRPETYFEVGSGNSTKFVRRAIRDHNLNTRIIPNVS